VVLSPSRTGTWPLAWSLAALLLAGASACDPLGSPVVVEALVPDSSARGGVALNDVTLERMLDLRTGRGQDFDVRGDFKVNVGDFSDLSGDFDVMVERIRGNGGADVDPHMSFDGTRYVADDYETLFYFSVTANFESAFAYARAAGDTSRASSSAENERAVVGLFASVVLSPLLPLPILSSDNAAYAAPVDGWLALRSAFQDGVPFAMHRGVIAHEFGHRLFFHNVFSSVDGGFELWQQDNTETELSPEQLRGQMLLKGIDEGLADVFAMAALADKDAINDAFSFAGDAFEPEAARRDVEGAFGTAATYDNLRDLSLDASHLQSCALTRPDFDQQFNFYCVGTVLAAAIWEAADRDPVVMATEMEPAVITALPGIGEVLVTGVPFDVDLFLEPFVQAAAPGVRRDKLCAQFAIRFESLVAAGKVPSCQ